MTRTLVLSLLLAAACGKSSSSDVSRCRPTLQHALDVYNAASNVSDDDKQAARDSLEEGVKACEAEHPPAAVFDCTMKATTVDDLKKCDKLRALPPPPPP